MNELLHNDYFFYGSILLAGVIAGIFAYIQAKKGKNHQLV